MSTANLFLTRTDGAVYPSSARGIMRFHLVYRGKLPASGNKSKLKDVTRIRREFSPQIKLLWETHPSLMVLLETGARPRANQMLLQNGQSARQQAILRPRMAEDLLAPIPVGSKQYIPLVRKSLDLGCELSVMFLRQEAPGQVVTQGGDLDGRMKLLLDALRMPQLDEQNVCPPEEDELYCLMQDDALVSRLDIDTDRLLVPETNDTQEVALFIEVHLNVLQVGPHNVCLL